jgi:hypothetical protein
MTSSYTAETFPVGAPVGIIYRSQGAPTRVTVGKVTKILKTRVLVEENGTQNVVRFIKEGHSITGAEGFKDTWAGHRAHLTLTDSEEFKIARDKIIESNMISKIRRQAEKISNTRDLATLDTLLSELAELHDALGIHLAKKGN